MEMCYNGALVMPSNYAVISNDEMEYIDGGLNGWQKALVAGVIAVASIAVIATLVTGTVAVAVAGFAAVMKLGVMSALIGAIGAKAAVTAVLTAIGVGTTITCAIMAKYG